MRSAHIVFFTIPQPVHVNPTLSTVQALVRRGHRVSYVTSQRHAEEVARLGAKVVLCPRLEYPRNQVGADDSVPMEQQYATGVRDLAARSFRAAKAVFDADKPDLIVFDTHSLAAVLMAERFRVPSVRITSHLRVDEQETFSRKIVGEFFSEHGVQNARALFTTAEETIYLFHEHLQLGSHDEADRHSYAPRCAAERPYVPTIRNDGMNHDHVLVSCSTYYVQGSDYFSMCVKAIQATSRPGLLVPSVQTDLSALAELPASCKVLKGVPLLEVMKFADILICQGGTATMMEALYHGLPMVTISNGNEHIEMYAENVARHGLGVHLRKADTTVTTIAECIRKVGDAGISANVLEMRRLVVGGAGGEEVATRLERVL